LPASAPTKQLPLPLGVKPPRKRRGNPEEVQQACLFKFVRAFQHREPRFRFIHGSMNGLPLFGKVLATASRTGLTKGIWDCNCPGRGVWEGQSMSGLYIELKATTGLTTEQKEFRDAYADLYAFVVAKEWVTAARAICSYFEIDDPYILEAIR
jgi:hypothetical protein